MLILVKPLQEYKDEIIDMLDEWHQSGEKIVPYAVRADNYRDFEAYCKNIAEKDDRDTEDRVPSTTLFVYDIDRQIMVGAVSIRHRLNPTLLATGGHIGDGVRPSERRKGYATRIIALALEECRKLGIDRVLVTCDKVNIGSAKSIMNNGGVLENEVIDDGEVVQRYWISLD